MERDRDIHVNLEDLARLADGTMEPREATALHEHLARCRSCTAAYAEAVRYRAAWLANPSAFRPTRALVDAGLRSRSQDTSIEHPVRTAPSSRVRRNRWIAAGAMITLVAAVAIVVGVVRMDRRIASPDLPAPIRAALEASSARGLVLPGGERGAIRASPIDRSGGTGAVSEPVKQAIEAYERGLRTSEQTYVVGAGLLAGGQLDAARGYVEEGLQHHPNDVPLLVLSADVAYRASELPSAERALRQALATRPRNAVVSIDLAIVLAESGHTQEAERLFRNVARGSAEPLAERARQELARISRTTPPRASSPAR